MRRVFADAVYWVALVHHKDHWHARAKKLAQSLRPALIVTTEEVFDEFLAYFSGHGPTLGDIAALTVESAFSNPSVRVHPQSHQSFLDGLALYKARPDKEYSLTDCTSMALMRQERITDVLTHDRHFTQEGFTILLV